MKFKAGQTVGIPCKVQPGPFSEEKLITVETVDGPISGFVKVENIKILDSQDDGVVKGIVVEERTETIAVRIAGSFFTTALGVASVAKNSLLEAA